ncbi:MAG TPA: glycosyltransferase, partial [Gemmata sp.]|nr:glycosyltransferase [Gemmata sp.]
MSSSNPGVSSPGLSEPRILVSLATYNEAGNIAALIAEIHKFLPRADILVIDDNSPDGTWKIVEEMGAADPRIHLLRRPGKLGLGTATLAAMKYAMDHNYDYLQNMDADFSHPPRYLPGILAGMSKYDVMIGSRYIAGGGTENWPLPRRMMSQGVNLLVRFLFRMPVKDASGA